MHSAVLRSSARFCPENAARGSKRLKHLSQFCLPKKKRLAQRSMNTCSFFFQDNHANLDRHWAVFLPCVTVEALESPTFPILDALQIAVQAIQLGDRRLIGSLGMGQLLFFWGKNHWVPFFFFWPPRLAMRS